MATSEVETVNLALSYLGENPIAALTDDTVAGRLANRIYPLERDALLRSHPWNFAIKRSTLGLLSDTPEFGWAYAYQLPNDCLRVLALNDDEAVGWPSADHKVEGRTLVTDEGTAQIRYIAQITDVATFDAAFVETLGKKLATEMCDALTGSTTRANWHQSRFDRKASEARASDGQEGSPDIVTDSSLLDVR